MPLTRRTFLAGSVGTGLVMSLGTVLPGCSREEAASDIAAGGASRIFSPAVWFEIGSDGPNFNDPLDADGGANQQQNFPIVRQIEHLAPQGEGSTRVVGKFHSKPSTTFDLDFYANPACSNFPREFLEGETYLGSRQVTTNGNETRPSTRPSRS